MGKKAYLGWAWRPDRDSVVAEWTGKEKSQRRKKKKRRKNSRRERLCRAPGEVFYNSKTWRYLRLRVLAKYGRKCMRCDAVDTELHVDHIVPRSKAPHLSLTFSNLQVLCRDCNMQKSNLYQKDYRDASASRDVELMILAEAREHL